jgi:hypothetical protein
MLAAGNPRGGAPGGDSSVHCGDGAMRELNSLAKKPGSFWAQCKYPRGGVWRANSHARGPPLRPVLTSLQPRVHGDNTFQNDDNTDLKCLERASSVGGSGNAQAHTAAYEIARQYKSSVLTVE